MKRYCIVVQLFELEDGEAKRQSEIIGYCHELPGETDSPKGFEAALRGYLATLGTEAFKDLSENTFIQPSYKDENIKILELTPEGPTCH